MRLRKSWAAFAVCAVAQHPCSGQHAGLTADPNPLSPGQAVTLVWHFVGDRIVLSGGRFGRGANVTARKSVTDRPRKTTRYAVVVWYRPRTKTAPAGPRTAQVHVRYEVVVRVGAAVAERLALYRDPQGWQVKVAAGWRHDAVRLPDPANNGLVFCQKEQDSVERLAVSVLPAQEGGPEGLTKRVRDSAYASYRQVRIVSEVATSHAGVPGVWMVFSGLDETHPGVATQSMVLTFVYGTRAYVVSARTSASRYSVRAAALEKMVRSLAPAGKLAEPPATRRAAPASGGPAAGPPR